MQKRENNSNTLPKVDVLNVLYHGQLVGRLTETKEHLLAFEYDPNWIENGFSISPLSLPLRSELFIPKKYDPFDGLFGVFSDSMPDGWGLLVMDRWLTSRGINPYTISPLTRLALVGHSGSGALEYQPELKEPEETEDTLLNLDKLAEECAILFETSRVPQTKTMDEIFALGGTSGGARPKATILIDGREWIVKFPCSLDREEVGKMEYDYALCARRCGLDVPEVKLLPSANCAGYFATQRFDHTPQGKFHVISVSALLETSHRIPNLDYDILMRLTLMLTEDMQEVEKMFRLMCFNVFAHNQDDHSRNFSFLYDDAERRWKLTPAYDLTYCTGMGEEHATMVHGSGKPKEKDLLECAKQIRLPSSKAIEILKQIKETVYQDLAEYLDQ